MCLQCRRPLFNSCVRKIPWRRKWQPTPVFFCGKSHGQRSLVGYSPWGHKKLFMTELLSMKYSELQITSENPIIWGFVVVLVVVVWVFFLSFFGMSVPHQYIIKEVFQCRKRKSRPRVCFQALPLSQWILRRHCLLYQCPEQENTCHTTLHSQCDFSRGRIFNWLQNNKWIFNNSLNVK